MGNQVFKFCGVCHVFAWLIQSRNSWAVIETQPSLPVFCLSDPNFSCALNGIWFLWEKMRLFQLKHRYEDPK